jgi:hypothetical protein
MKTRQEYAKQLWRLVLNYQRQNLGMPTDIDVERERAKFIAAIGDGDRTDIVRLAADLEVDRILRNTAAEGIVVMTVEEKATFRELVRTATLDSAALLGLIPPPSKSQLARLDAFLTMREATRHADPRATMPSSSAALH